MFFLAVRNHALCFSSDAARWKMPSTFTFVNIHANSWLHSTFLLEKEPYAYGKGLDYRPEVAD